MCWLKSPASLRAGQNPLPPQRRMKPAPWYVPSGSAGCPRSVGVPPLWRWVHPAGCNSQCGLAVSLRLVEATPQGSAAAVPARTARILCQWGVLHPLCAPEHPVRSVAGCISVAGVFSTWYGLARCETRGPASPRQEASGVEHGGSPPWGPCGYVSENNRRTQRSPGTIPLFVLGCSWCVSQFL